MAITDTRGISKLEKQPERPRMAGWASRRAGLRCALPTLRPSGAPPPEDSPATVDVVGERRALVVREVVVATLVGAPHDRRRHAGDLEQEGRGFKYQWQPCFFFFSLSLIFLVLVVYRVLSPVSGYRPGIPRPACGTERLGIFEASTLRRSASNTVLGLPGCRPRPEAPPRPRVTPGRQPRPAAASGSQWGLQRLPRSPRLATLA